MEAKNFIKIINEEISNFDFLGNEEYTKEEENVDLLKNEDFQKQFICDSLVNNKLIKINANHAQVGGDWEEGNNATHLNLDYQFDVKYQYDPNKEPIKFSLQFEGNNVKINVHSNHSPGNYGEYIPPSGEAYYTDIEWSDVNVVLTTVDGDEIDFTAFRKAPVKIQSLFIREYAEDIITNKTMEANMKKDNPLSIPYC